MIDEGAVQAIGRIERALARLEGVSARPAAQGPSSAEFDALREAHRTLRAGVEGALARIDALLATGEAR